MSYKVIVYVEVIQGSHSYFAMKFRELSSFPGLGVFQESLLFQANHVLHTVLIMRKTFLSEIF